MVSGYSEFLFGLESHINETAKKLGIDPVEFRRRNAIQPGDILTYGSKMNNSGLLECIDKAAKAIDWDHNAISKDPNKVIGKGFACFWKAPAMPPNAASTAFIKFNEDGSLNILVFRHGNRTGIFNGHGASRRRSSDNSRFEN